MHDEEDEPMSVDAEGAYSLTLKDNCSLKISSGIGIEDGDKKKRKKRKREEGDKADPDSHLEPQVDTSTSGSKKEKKEKKKRRKEETLATSTETAATAGPSSPTSKEPSHSRPITGSSFSVTAAASPDEANAFLTKHSVTITTPPSVPQVVPVIRFSQLDVPAEIQSSFAGFKEPTPIQACTWPPALDGRDVVGIAETGR